MGLLSIIRKVKRKEKEMRILMVYVPPLRVDSLFAGENDSFRLKFFPTLSQDCESWKTQFLSVDELASCFTNL